MNSAMAKQSGVSMIEMMLSVVIGMVIVAAVSVMYLSTGRANRYQAAQSEMNENAQIALNIIGRDLQAAGYSSVHDVSEVNGVNRFTKSASFDAGGAGQFVFGCDSGFATVASASYICNASGNANAIEIQYEADEINTVLTSTNVPTDCLGNALAVSSTLYVARNRYHVMTGATGRPELHCASRANGGKNEPLVDNVEVLRIWYGVGNASGQIGQYLGATALAAAGLGWADVYSVRLCVLMRSAEKVLDSGEDGTRAYLDCDLASQTSNDNYLRRTYFSTVALRNKLAP